MKNRVRRYWFLRFIGVLLMAVVGFSVAAHEIVHPSPFDTCPLCRVANSAQPLEIDATPPVAPPEDLSPTPVGFYAHTLIPAPVSARLEPRGPPNITS